MNMFGWCMWHTMHWTGRDRAREGVLQRMPGLVLSMVGSSVCDGAVVAERARRRSNASGRGRWRRPRGRRATRRAIVARLVVGADEPQCGSFRRVLVMLMHRHGDARAGARAAIRLRGNRGGRARRASAVRRLLRQPGLRRTDCRCCGRRARRRGKCRRAGSSPTPAAASSCGRMPLEAPPHDPGLTGP